MAHWGSTAWIVERDRILRDWFGDVEAYKFLVLISRITELWDDIVDGDKELEASRINKVFFDAMILLPSDPFYMKHREHLTPLLIAAINSWQDANVLATGDRNQKALAYTLRNMDIQIVQAIIYITRGYDVMRDLGPAVWTLFAADQDDILTWIEGSGT